MILIIDDDVAVRTSVSLLLKQAGYMTASAADPKEALQQLQSYEISLIILDMNFSLETTGDEGLALLTEIKRTAPAVPVISSQATMTRSWNAGSAASGWAWLDRSLT